MAGDGQGGRTRMRASDADRQKVVDALRQATGAGYLTLDELEQRVGAAYSSRYVDDLGPLLADIPGGLAALPGRAPAPLVPTAPPTPWAAGPGPFRGWIGPPAMTLRRLGASMLLIVFSLVWFRFALAVHAVWPLLLFGVFLLRWGGRNRWHRRAHWHGRGRWPVGTDWQGRPPGRFS